MRRTLHTIFFLILGILNLYAIEDCEDIIEKTNLQLRAQKNLEPLNLLLENLECFKGHNVDSILYFNLQEQYLEGNYEEVDKYIRKIAHFKLKKKNIQIIEIFNSYELEKYNETLSMISSFFNEHTFYFPIQLLQAKIYRIKGEYQISNNCLNKIKPLNQNQKNRIQIHRANNYYNLNLKDSTKNIYQNLINYKGSKSSSILFNYANLLLQENEYRQAVEYYNEYLDLNNASKIQFSMLNKGRVHTNMMQCYGKMNNDSILMYKDSAFLYKCQYLQKNIDPEYGAIHQNLAEYYLMNGQYTLAMNHIDSSIFHHIHHLSSANVETLMRSNMDFNLIHDKLGLLEYLEIKHKISKKVALQDIDTIYQVKDQLIRAIKKENYGVQSKLFSQDKLSKYYEDAYLYYFNKNELNKAIQFSQKLKGTILLESINHSEATNVLEPPIREQYLHLRYQRNKLISSLIHDEMKDSLTNLLSKNLIKQRELEKIIQNTTPQFYNQLYVNQSFDTKNIQNALNDKEVLLDYILAKDSIYLIEITHKSIKAQKALFSNKQFEELHLLKSVISKPPNIIKWSPKETSELKQRLHSLSNKLLFPHKDSFDKIMIITHDELRNFPFICLTNQHLQYILESKQITYEPNIMLWLKNNQHTLKMDKLLIVDPYSKDNTSPNFLPFANKEVDHISKIFSSVKVDSTNLKKMKSFPIIHFLTHAVIDTLNPMKSYLKQVKDSTSLTMENIKHAHLNNDLVFISSCESNSGLLSKNEGILSLSRSFLEAGAKSVIATYWPIDDYSSSLIVSNFYSNLQSHVNVSKALQEAQIQYLSDAGYYESHPFFWAAFHPNGNSFNSKSNTNLFWLTGILIIGLICAYFFLRKP